MEKMERLLKAVGMSVLLALTLSRSALAQQNPLIQITGTVTSVGKVPLGGVAQKVGDQAIFGVPVLKI